MTYLAARVSNKTLVGFLLNDKKTFSALELHSLKSSNVRQPISLLLTDMMSVQY